jgi:hypothetical protein
LLAEWKNGRKESAHAPKLMATSAQRRMKMALEEYQKQLELAIENH